LREHHAALLTALFRACTQHAWSIHKKTRALARELLDDRDTFWVVLDCHRLPLTNNEAERALRHLCLARRIGNGTRSAEGTRAFANLTSVIRTCRKRPSHHGPTSLRCSGNAAKACPRAADSGGGERLPGLNRPTSVGG
jgi:hypothetical protein